MKRKHTKFEEIPVRDQESISGIWKLTTKLDFQLSLVGKYTSHELGLRNGADLYIKILG